MYYLLKLFTYFNKILPVPFVKILKLKNNSKRIYLGKSKKIHKKVNYRSVV